MRQKISIAPSLFEPPASPVLSSAANWLTGTLFGSVATILCVIAVAFVGLMMTSGRFAVRDGARVILGCFVLLGASVIATGLRDVAENASSSPLNADLTSETPATASMPADAYDR